jgi:hypothetical protein
MKSEEAPVARFARSEIDLRLQAQLVAVSILIFSDQVEVVGLDF